MVDLAVDLLTPAPGALEILHQRHQAKEITVELELQALLNMLEGAAEALRQSVKMEHPQKVVMAAQVLLLLSLVLL